MQFTVEKAALISAMAAVSKSVEAKSTMPILSHVLLSVGRDTLRITGTNTDMEAAVSIPVNSASHGEFTLPASDLLNIVKAMPDGAEITIKKDGDRYSVSSGRSKYKLPSLNAEDFPHFGTDKNTATFTIKAEELARLINLTLFATSTDTTKYYLNGALFHVIDGNLAMVATDGHRMAVAKITAPDGSKDMPDIIIPRPVLQMIQGLSITGSFEIGVSETKFTMQHGSFILRSKVIDGTFPDYTRLIPDDGPVSLKTDAKELKATTARVALVAKEKTSAVRFSIAGGNCALSARGADGCEGEDVLPITDSVGDLEIGFNAKYMAEVCQACGDGTVSIFMRDGGAPVLMKLDDDPNVLFIVMPMRVV